MRPARAWLAIALWAGVLAIAAFVIAGRIPVVSDLRLFLPQPQTDAERILVEELEEGPGTRLMLVALSGLTPAELASASARLHDRLSADPLYTRVENGALAIDARLQALLLRYRYLLTPRPAGCACDIQELSRELEARVGELLSPAAALVQDLALRDPTGEVQAILENLTPAREPQLIDGVWFTSDGERALLLLQTAAPGFDADRQRLALDALASAVREVDDSGRLTAEATGPGPFTALLSASVRTDVSRLGTLAGLGSALFLLLVLRSFRHAALGLLTLATAGFAALFTIALVFDSVHGITLAFGFTLLGVAMDYPVHVLLHQQPDTHPRQTLRKVWPTLRLSIVTTCLAYLALSATGFTGLVQLGVFTVGGLIGTALIVQRVLPHLMGRDIVVVPPHWVHGVNRLPSMPAAVGIVLVLGLAAIAWGGGSLWNNDLSGLAPVPQPLLDADVELRRELGAPDLRYALAIREADAESVLRRDEALTPQLQRLLDAGIIGGYAQPSRILPSQARQIALQTALPDTEVLRARLKTATADVPFKPESFEPFLADVEQSRNLPPLQLSDVAGTALGERLRATLWESPQGATGLITLTDVRDPMALQAWVATTASDVLFLDLTQTSENLVERYRTRALIALSVALVVIALTMVVQLGWRTAVVVILPVLATLAATVATLHLAGVALTLFHLVSLLLVAGLSFDYGLFFNREEADARDAASTRYSVMVCWLSTAGAFALLTISQLPVLRAIGMTVTLGVTLGFLLALLARRTATRHD